MYKRHGKEEEKKKEKEEGGGGGERGKGGGYGDWGLLDAKLLVPDCFDGSETKWRTFKEQMEMYMMARSNKVAQNLKDLLPKEFTNENENDEINKDDEGIEGMQLMALLRTKVKGEGERILRALAKERGFEGWRRLRRWYDRRKEDLGVQAHIELMAMASKKAKNVQDLRRNLVEMDEKRRMAEDVGIELSLIHI